MMRKSFLAFSLLAIVSLFGANVAQGCGGCWAPRSCCYVASPCCCYVPTCSWTCCDPCCRWSCCYYSYSTCRCYSVVPSQGVSGCSSCGPVATSPSGASLKPVPEKGVVPQNQR